MTKEFEIISEATKNYVICSGAKGYEEFKLISTLSNIIINVKDRKDNFKFIKKYSFKEIDKLVTNFLEELNPSYREYYEIRKEDGSIIFDNNKEKYNDGAFSEYDEIYNNRIIYIPLRGTLEDAFAIIHELFHDINADEKHKSIARMFCTEGISLLGEMLLEDYLVANKVKDARTSMNHSLYCVKSKAIELDFNIKLVLKYLENNYIDVADIMDLIETYPGNYGSDLSFSIQKIVELEDLTIDVEQTYILGTLLATYMYDRIKNNKNNINELFELNQELKNYKFGQVLDYLEIKCNGWDFHDDTYEKLERCYKKYIKSR
ncbi:MAG: hypothetical protein E7157_04495 [Lactobacillales bacterium]|nr:hypothetical protein [Lactobacillales bacterium]